VSDSTIWTEETVQRYEQWFDSPLGRYVLAREKRFLQHMISPWPRRRQHLLEVGCGTGFFLEMFWEAGFDVTGVDRAPTMISRARERMGDRVDFHLGVAEELPFDDNEFDFVSLITVLEFCDDPARALCEAHRVARKGVLVGFLNRYSLYYLSRGRKRKGRETGLLRNATWFSWPEMKRILIETMGTHPMQARSILLGPPSTWRSCPGVNQFNELPLFPWCGAFAAVRVDLYGKPVVTPLLQWKRNRAREPVDGVWGSFKC
jgi:SAM-dependent methyltransferase